MVGPRSWTPLPLAVPGIPSLLVSSDFTHQSYTIHITDLANVWTESLDKKPIIMRGLKEDTSIDPTDGPDQIQKLLDLLRAAFDPSSPEHGDTSMALSSGGTNDGDNALAIHVTVILPGGLRPLKWPVHLKKRTPSAIATELVLPLVQAHQARAQEITELVATLRDKDGVITKLVDKLEATGTGLEHIFTSLSGRRKVTRTIAEERVKGLAPFRLADFRKRSSDARSESESVDIAELLDSVFGGTGLALLGADSDIDDSPALNDWWTKLGRGKHVALVQRGKEKFKRTETPPPPAQTTKATRDDDDDDDDDFQVQTTPPGLATGKRGTSTWPKMTANIATTAAADDDDETSDGEDSDITDTMPSESQRTARTGADVKSSSSSSRLGAIGKRVKPPPPPRSPSPALVSPAQKSDNDDGSATASDVDDDDDEPLPPQPKSQPLPRRAVALGHIGGGGRPTAGPGKSMDATAATPDSDEEEDQRQERSSVPTATTTTTTTPKRGTRLGAIGRVAAVGGGEGEMRGRKTTPATKEEEREQEAEQQQAEQRPRETSRERADRKRDELQKELQKRAGAGPARKKRKF